MARKNLGALVQSIGAPAESPTAEKAETPQPEAPETTPVAQTQVVEETPAPVAKKPARPTAKAAAEPVGEEAPGTSDAAATAGIQVMIPQDLNDRLQDYLKKRKISHAKLLIEAIEKTYKRLPQLVNEAQGLEDDDEDDDDRVFLFERPARERQQTAGAPRAKHHVRLTPKNRKLLDVVTEYAGAPSRNFMITVAYDAYLPPIKTES
ncbi:hypothetical protein [Microbacterium aurantiacum]|uniref:hypothetical protein n=1 Tax=Microbacterium aurantiacum TaxID=162393 RepID=UPI0011AF6373|nr:hypothetical protein [Microbacterium aurantiacum]